MSALFEGGRIVDLILAFTALEAALVVLYHRRTGRGPAPADFLVNLVLGRLPDAGVALRPGGRLVGLAGAVPRRRAGGPPDRSGAALAASG